MAQETDARLPVVFGDIAMAGPNDALLIEGDAPAPPGLAVARFSANPLRWHAVGCACCTPRAAVAAALGRLFLARARNEVAFYRRVIAVVSDPEAVRAAVAADALAAGRFRLEGTPRLR
jgi:hypothetical protein